MPFATNARVRVTNQKQDSYGQLGTVTVDAATAGDGFNRVRLDGHRKTQAVALADNELVVSNFTAAVDYTND